MPSSTSGYGAYNPAAVDPYPIETDLAKLAVGNSPENAANLLDLYQLQRTTDAANYGHEMGIQHDFAKQQLAQQLKETYLKNAMDAIKTHGGVSVFNQLAPEQAIRPDIAGPIETGLGNAQAATTAEHAASAAKHGLEAGFSTDLPRLTGMSGGLLTGQTTPLQLQVQAARNAGHGGGGGGGGRGSMNLPIRGLFTDDMQSVPYNVKINPNDSDDVIRARIARAKQIASFAYPEGPGVAGATPPGGTAAPPGTTAAPPRTPQQQQQRPQTRLQNNPNTAPQGGPQAASSTYIRDPRAQAAARVAAQHLTPQAKADVGPNIQGTVMPIVPLVGGGVGFVGKNGAIHVLPPAGSK